MPRSIINTVFHHHNPFYRGEDYQLCLITFYNDYLLGQLGVGDAAIQSCPGVVYEILQISEDDEKVLLEAMQSCLPDIEYTVDTLIPTRKSMNS